MGRGLPAHPGLQRRPAGQPSVELPDTLAKLNPSASSNARCCRAAGAYARIPSSAATEYKTSAGRNHDVASETLRVSAMVRLVASRTKYPGLGMLRSNTALLRSTNGSARDSRAAGWIQEPYVRLAPTAATAAGTWSHFTSGNHHI